MNHSDHIAKSAGLLSLIEIGLGSLLHSFKIPFAGHFLSLNQGFILAKSSLELKHAKGYRLACWEISNVAAILKSLSPAGKKLTPMLALSMQGFLFNLSTLFLGINFLGISFGMVLLSLWGFIQPLIIYYFLFGENFLSMLQFYHQQIHKVIAVDLKDIFWILAGLVGAKIILALSLSIFSFRIDRDSFEKYKNYFLNKKIKKKRATESSGLLEIFSWPFLVSLILTFLFLYLSHSNLSEMIWGVLRPIALAFLLVFSLKLIPIEKIKSESLRKALKEISS
ncbi:MAG: hypothetical protein H6621_06460 [Halobacteriovoraceae bacterium]|nr:hypothetical protein [Halobacteriovoraceae bacterium]